MKIIGRFGYWLGFIAVVVIVMPGFYLLKAFQAEQRTDYDQSRQSPKSSPSLQGSTSTVHSTPTVLASQGDPTAYWKTFYSRILKLSFRYPPQIILRQSELNNMKSTFISLESDNGYMTIANSCEDRSIMPLDDMNAKVGSKTVKRYNLSSQDGYKTYGINFTTFGSRCVDIVQTVKEFDEQATRELFDAILATFSFSSEP